jgi:hypothetical protein
VSCQRCGGVLATELADAMRELVCPMVVIEGRHCHCDDVEDPVQTNLPRKVVGALAGESPETTHRKGDHNDELWEKSAGG